jgi:hypothetical protein
MNALAPRIGVSIPVRTEKGMRVYGITTGFHDHRP